MVEEKTRQHEYLYKLIEEHKKDRSLSEQQKETITKFDKYNSARGVNITTRFSYVKVLRLLAFFLKKPYDEIIFEDMVDYYAEPKLWDHRKKRFTGKFLDKNSLWTYQNAHLVFFDWLGKRELVEKIKKIKVKRSSNGKVKREDILTPKEIKLLIDHAKNMRDKVIIALLYECNARREELVNLKVKDVNFDEYGANIEFRRGLKTESSERTVPIIDFAPLLREYIDNYHPFKNNGESYLFLTHVDQRFRNREKNTALAGDTVYNIIKDVAKISGLSKKKRVYPHILRHSKTTTLLLEGCPQPIVQKLGGWTSSRQIDRTYGHLTSMDAKQFLLKQRGLLDENGKEARDVSLDVKKCPRCNIRQSATNKYCNKCWLPLNMKIAVKDREAEKEIKEVFNYALKHPKMKFVDIMDKFRKGLEY